MSMKRKINKVGTNTLTVSLPSKWAQKYDLKQGDELDVEEEGAVLKIASKSIPKGKTLQITIDAPEKYMDRLVYGPYLKGYDEITYRYTSVTVYSKILAAVKNTLGFEVIESDEKKCVIKELSNLSEENFLKLISRLFSINKTMANSLQESLKNGLKQIEDLIEIEYSCDKLTLYCRRIINKNIASGKTEENTALYHIACLLEQTGDELRFIAEYFKINSQKYIYDEKLDPLFNALKQSLDFTLSKVNNYLGKRDHGTFIELALKQRSARHEAHKVKDILMTLKAQNIIVAHHLMNAIEHVQHMSEELV
jgi:phosphate uptake regulator